MDIQDHYAAPDNWVPQYSRWRHGGWYVSNVHFPQGHVGCVSRNYLDRKWRIACDKRRSELGEPGDFTYPSRDAAAKAEYALAAAEHARLSLDNAIDLRHPYSDYTLKQAIRLATSTAYFAELEVPKNLPEVRRFISDMLKRSDHNWITAMVALDLLDAAIDGRDLTKSCRIL